MNTRASRLREKLSADQLPTLLKINCSDPRIVELAGLCGVDGVWLCQEHVPTDWSSLENMIRAARVHGIDSLVRVARGSYSDYIRPFEAGATGIIVPHVASADEARQIVDWVRFRPIGRRALDGGNIDGSFCLIPPEQYIRDSNEGRLVILQIESPEALDQVEAIAAVPGFDGLMFGPGDFSHRIDRTGQLNSPEVAAARARIGSAARHHKKIAVAPGLIAPLATLLDEGYRVFNLGADVVAISSFIRERLKQLESQALAIGNQPRANPYA